MKYSYVARQPILDADKKTIGYELLFRDGPKNTFPEVEPELATSRLLSDHFLSTHYNTLGDKLGFVNFPYASLINLVPTLFPKESLVVEVLEDCEPTDELLEAIKTIYDAGYTIALDDFVPSKAWKRFLPYVSIIKFDIRLISITKASMFMSAMKELNIQFLAEKVETYDEYQEAKQAGFTYFQGYFFSKPEMIQTRALNPAFLTGMFSLLDSLFDQPLQQVLDSVPIDEEIKQALIQRKGVLGAIMAMVIAYEQARWDEATRIRKLLKLSEAELGQAYDEATTWAQELLSPSLK